MAVEWYYRVMGEEIGPLTAAELRKRALDGQITHDTLVTRTGTEEWVTADRVTGLLSPPSPAECNEGSAEVAKQKRASRPPDPAAEIRDAWNALSPRQRRDAVTFAGILGLLFVLVMVGVHHLNSGKDRRSAVRNEAETRPSYAQQRALATHRHEERYYRDSHGAMISESEVEHKLLQIRIKINSMPNNAERAYMEGMLRALEDEWARIKRQGPISR